MAGGGTMQGGHQEIRAGQFDAGMGSSSTKRDGLGLGSWTCPQYHYWQCLKPVLSFPGQSSTCSSEIVVKSSQDLAHL